MEPENAFINAWSAAHSEDDVILVLFDTNRPEKFGMVRLDAANQILEIVDKPKKTNLTQMWGAIIWRPRFTEYLHHCVSQRGLSDFAQILLEVLLSTRSHNHPLWWPQFGPVASSQDGLPRQDVFMEELWQGNGILVAGIASRTQRSKNAVMERRLAYTSVAYPGKTGITFKSKCPPPFLEPAMINFCPAAARLYDTYIFSTQHK